MNDSLSPRDVAPESLHCVFCQSALTERAGLLVCSACCSKTPREVQERDDDET